jgi:phage terminase large subunit
MSKNKSVNIEIPYTPRPLQQKLHELIDQHRFTVLVMHRRFGKTVCAINHMIKRAILEPRDRPRLAYIAPTRVQAKLVAWDYLKFYCASIPDVSYNETELRADFPNGARIQLLGAENPSSLRGIYLDFACVDEVADCPESLFPEILRPALSDRKGTCVFLGTPRGHNYFFDLWETAESANGWGRAMYKASETGIVDSDELEAAAATMSEDQYNQEFECSWVANVPGSVFGKELQKANDDGRITEVPYDPSAPVETSFDIGMHDYTSVWFYQRVGRSIHFIDYYQNRGEGLPHYVQMLQERDYVYSRHNGPHDLEVREIGSGKTRREVAYDLGLTFRIVPRIPVHDGIHAARMLIPMAWFDQAKCREGLEALRYYHYAYDERSRRFRDKPVHSWASHAADSFRYASIAIEKFDDRARAPQVTADNNYNPLEVAL